MDTLVEKLIELGSEYGIKLVSAIIVLIVGLSLVKLLVKLVKKGKLFNKLPDDVSKFTLSVFSFLLKMLVILSVIAILGVPMASIVALLGTAGLAVGLGLQGSLGNFAGGIILMIFRPFHVGDFIDTGTHSGFVEEIGVYYTYLLTIDNSRVVIPNSVVSNISLKDLSAHDKRRVDIVFSVSYSSDIDKVKTIMTETAVSHELVLKDPEPFARLIKQDESSLNFVLRAWCKTEDYWSVYFDLNEQIKKVFDANEIVIPFKQIDVHMKQ